MNRFACILIHTCSAALVVAGVASVTHGLGLWGRDRGYDDFHHLWNRLVGASEPPANVGWLPGSTPVSVDDVNPGGDVTRGQRIFNERGCAKCHTIDGSMTSVGPDLAEVGKTLDRRALIESIETPGLNTKTGFETWQLRTHDGYVHIGRLAGSDTQRVTMVTQTGARIEIDRADIASLQTSELSMMPTGLLIGLDEQGRNDLLAYLMSLRGRPARDETFESDN